MLLLFFPSKHITVFKETFHRVLRKSQNNRVRNPSGQTLKIKIKIKNLRWCNLVFVTLHLSHFSCHHTKMNEFCLQIVSKQTRTTNYRTFKTSY